MIKLGRVAEILRQRGYEKGSQYLFEYLVEQQNAMNKSLNELAQQQIAIIDTISNVVQGTSAMRDGMMEMLKKTGLAEAEDMADEPSTYNIGEKPQ